MNQINHPATNVLFDDLYSELLRDTEHKLITRTIGTGDFAGLELFNYTDLCQREALWTFGACMARGLVVCPAEKRIIAFPFPKFFNWNEPGVTIPDLPFRATEKMDGSLGIVFCWRGEWRVVTRGNFTSRQAAWATNWLAENRSTFALELGNTYLVEIIYRDNQVVIDYDFENLVLLGAYTSEGVEIPYEELHKTCLDVTKTVSGNGFKDLVEFVGALPESREGVVVRFDNGERVKIKGRRYLELSRLVANVRPLAIWEQMLTRSHVEIPKGFECEYWSIRLALERRENALLSELHRLANWYARSSDREVGLALQRIGEAIPVSKFLFTFRKTGFSDYFRDSQLRMTFFKLFRPTGDKL